MIPNPLKVGRYVELLDHLVSPMSQALSHPQGLGLVPEFQLPPRAHFAVGRHEQAGASPTRRDQKQPLNSTHVSSGGRDQSQALAPHHQERPVDPPSLFAPRSRRTRSDSPGSEQPIGLRQFARAVEERPIYPELLRDVCRERRRSARNGLQHPSGIPAIVYNQGGDKMKTLTLAMIASQSAPLQNGRNLETAVVLR